MPHPAYCRPPTPAVFVWGEGGLAPLQVFPRLREKYGTSEKPESWTQRGAQEGYGGKEGRTREESDGKGKERKLHFFSPSHHSFRPLSLTINSNIPQKVIASDWGQCRGGEGRWKLYTGYRPWGLMTFQPASFLAKAEVYKTAGNEAYLREDYSNAVYFYTEGIKVNCMDEDLRAELYSNRAYRNLRLGKVTCNLKIKKYCLLSDSLTTDVECLWLALEWSVRGFPDFTDLILYLICFELTSLRLLWVIFSIFVRLHFQHS